MAFISGKNIIFPLVLIIGLSSCAKKPEKPLSPSVKLNIEKKGDVQIVTANFSCGLKNENANTAFTDISGVFELKKGSSVLLDIPFKKDVILPFETGVIEEKTEISAEKISPVLELLGIEKSEIESGGEMRSRFIDEQNIAIKKLDFEKRDITALLRSRLKK